MGKIFKFLVFTFPEKYIASLLMPPFSSQKSRQNFLKMCFPQQQKGVEKTVICLVKTQSEILKMTWNIRLFIFCMKSMMALQFCKQYLSYSVILSLLLLHCNHNNLTLKFDQKK